jgi:hypothetical protein
MPYDVKAVLSGIVLIVAAILSYWSKSPIRPDFSTLVMVMAVLMVAAMWVFPEAGVKKGGRQQRKVAASIVAGLVPASTSSRSWSLAREMPGARSRASRPVQRCVFFHAALLRASSAL